MSDTKTLIKYMRDRLNDGPNITFGKPTVRDLVDALEQAEARLNGCGEDLKRAAALAEQAEARAEKEEASVARLTKMVDWLAGRCSEELGFTEKGMQELRGM